MMIPARLPPIGPKYGASGFSLLISNSITLAREPSLNAQLPCSTGSLNVIIVRIVVPSLHYDEERPSSNGTTEAETRIHTTEPIKFNAAAAGYGHICDVLSQFQRAGLTELKDRGSD